MVWHDSNSVQQPVEKAYKIKVKFKPSSFYQSEFDLEMFCLLQSSVNLFEFHMKSMKPQQILSLVISNHNNC